MKITTNMKGFQRWMREHPRKRVDGYFDLNGQPMSHEQIKTMVNYAVEKGYRTEIDIPYDGAYKSARIEQRCQRRRPSTRDTILRKYLSYGNNHDIQRRQ